MPNPIDSQLQKSFGSSNAIVARDIGSSNKVRMTKFQYLSPEQQQNSINLYEPNDHPDQCYDAALIGRCHQNRSISTIDLSKQKHPQQCTELNNMNSKAHFGQGKVPWLMSAPENTKSAKSSSRLNLSTDNLNLHSPEPFQIVWRKLAYEVKANAFEFSTRYLRKRLQEWKGLGVGSSSSNASTTDATDTDFSMQNVQKSALETSSKVNLNDTNANPNPNQVPNANNLNSLTSATSTATLNQHQNNKRVIFENLNGYARSGEITAILGPSGAGKTSLLNALCGRTTNYKGTIQLIGARHKKHMQLSIIPQKDYLMENLTVRENLIYSSRILNVEKGFNHEANIMRVVKMLNLVNCFNSLGKNLSGGEYKRVSIAQELLRQPDILILDEPTSGLDSLNCKNLIKSLTDLIDASRRGSINPIAIIMTIHQPDIDIYSMFDHVYCIARKGRVIFDGHPSETMEVLRSRAGFADSDSGPVVLRQEEASSPGTTTEPSTDEIDSRVSLTRLGSTLIGLNPANLLIEIASESMYGDDVINRLAACQREQFEQYAAAITSLSSATSRHGSILSLSNGSSQHLQTLADENQQVSRSDTPSLSKKDATSKRDLINISHDSLHLGKSGSSKKQTSQWSEATSQLVRDKRLDSRNRHKGLFWYHTCLLTRRAFLATFRDPLMTLVAFGFHLMIPIVMYVVYSPNIGKVTGCPLLVREMNILSLASNDTYGKLEQLQEDFMTTMEGAAMLFLSMYSFSMCSLAVAALAFPLNMHILLKELRNGWYRLPTYVLAKTISSIPFEVLFPVISLIMIYSVLGLPSSYMEWRMIAIASVMALISMISHTQGLVAGALFMDDVQTAIFLSIASTLPQVLLSGFTARIRQMPTILQYLSWFSQYRYASDLNSIIRYGFGICSCENSTDKYLRETKPAFTDVPQQMKSFLLFYLNDTIATDEPDAISNDTNSVDSQDFAPGIIYDFVPSTARKLNILKALEASNEDLFDRMAELVTRSFSYGRKITNCESVRSQGLALGYNPPDSLVPYMFGMLVLLVFIWKAVLYFVVKFKIASRI